MGLPTRVLKPSGYLELYSSKKTIVHIRSALKQFFRVTLDVKVDDETLDFVAERYWETPRNPMKSTHHDLQRRFLLQGPSHGGNSNSVNIAFLQKRNAASR